MRMALPPASRMCRTVGRAARIRRSLVMFPAASCGTLKSTRTSTRLPRRSFRSARVFLAIVLPLADHVAQQIDAAMGVAPLVVVPAHQLEEAAVQLDARAGVEDA